MFQKSSNTSIKQIYTNVSSTTSIEHQFKCNSKSTSTSTSGCESILTQITSQPPTDDESESEPICVQLYEESVSEMFRDDSFDFVPNENPGIEQYMEFVEDDNYVGSDKYRKECHKYSLPPISHVLDILDGKSTTLDLNVGVRPYHDVIFYDVFLLELYPAKYWHRLCL